MPANGMREVFCKVPLILSLATRGDERSASSPCGFTYKDRSPGTLRVLGDLDVSEIRCPSRHSKPRPSSPYHSR